MTNDDLPDGRGAPKGNTNAVTHGLFTSTDRFLEAIEPTEEAMVWELFDELLEESIYDFNVAHEERTFDMEETATIEVPSPTRKIDQALSLFNAALDAVKMTKVNAELLEHKMETTEVSHAQLNQDGKYETIEESTEHYLNLAYSRLVKDRSDLLEHGGVGIEDSSEQADPSMTMEFYDDPLATEPTNPESVNDDEITMDFPSIRNGDDV